MKFEELKLSAPLLKSIKTLGYTDCTPIQEQSIPHLMEGKDLAGLAQTGTGKTAAFILPLMERVLKSSMPITEVDQEYIDLQKVRGFPDWKPFHWILILVPTRELAEQVLQNINSYGTEAGIKGCAIYGGTGYEKQKEALKRGVTFIVATPGRLIDLYKEHNVDLKLVRAVVFDEADRMFDMGFKDDMKFILDRIPKDRQFLVFSATLNLDVLNTAYQYGASPVEINVSRDQAKAENVEDSIFHLGQEEKPKYLLSILKINKPQQTIIFSNFKNQIESIVSFLRTNEIPAVGISSLLNQTQRNRVIEQFKGANSTNVLVATDVAARGLDIQGVDLVINFELPMDSESYVHRIGRTGRAGQIGKAFSFVSDRDVESLQRIEDYLKHKVKVSWMEDSQLIENFIPMKSSHETFGHRSHGFAESSEKRDYKDRKGKENKNYSSHSHRKNQRDRDSKPSFDSHDKYRRDRPKSKGHSKPHEIRQEAKESFNNHKSEPYYRKGRAPYKENHSKDRFSREHHNENRKHYKNNTKPSVYKVTFWSRLVRSLKRLFKF